MGSDEALTIRYAEHAPVRRLIDLVTYAAEGISLDFDHWDDPTARGPGLYFVVVAGTSIDEFADPMGTNRWPTEECAALTEDFDAFFDAAGTVALGNDGAVVVVVDGTICPQMIRLKDLSAAEIAELDVSDTLEYADWMGARHMSALDTSARKEVVAAVTLSEETGRVTRFRDGAYKSCPREKLGGRWRVDTDVSER
jgi:hypothetical protein